MYIIRHHRTHKCSLMLRLSLVSWLCFPRMRKCVQKSCECIRQKIRLARETSYMYAMLFPIMVVYSMHATSSISESGNRQFCKHPVYTCLGTRLTHTPITSTCTVHVYYICIVIIIIGPVHTTLYMYMYIILMILILTRERKLRVPLPTSSPACPDPVSCNSACH